VKVTHKGNIFKTDEGEMWLSCRQMTNPEKFYFSVTSDSIAKVLMNMQDECVQLSYVQYRATLPWRGDSRYIVMGVTPIGTHPPDKPIILQVTKRSPAFYAVQGYAFSIHLRCW
jgi:hypothetical protein